MSEPDSTPSRRPPTIELKATEVEADKPGAGNDPAAENARTDDASGQQSPKPAAGGPGGARSSIITTFAGIAAGALVVAAIGAGLWFAGYVPPRESAPVPNAQAPDSTAIAEISAWLKKIEGAIAAQQQPVPPQPPDPAPVSRLAAAEAATKSLTDSLAALTHRVDEVAAAAQTALAQAKSAAQTGVARSDLDALAARIAALEGAVKTLADDVKHQTASADDRVARLTIAAEALRAAVERGAPYQAELAAVKSLGADQSATAPLEPFAGTGVPGAAALAR